MTRKRGQMLTLAVAMAVGVLACAHTGHSQISKGNQILINRGLQVQGMVTSGDVFHLATYSNANYSSINWLWDSSPSQMGAAPGFPWSRWVGDENNVPPIGSEGPYMNQLVSLQLGDEWNLNDINLRNRAVNWFNSIRSNFPNTILYMNNFGGQVGDAQLGDFITRARPDMLSFDAYPWRADYTTRNPLGGPPTSWYGDLRRYREHAKGANVPMASYVQTFHAVQDWDQTVYRDPSPSELRLNHFGALAFNAKVLIDFTYNTGASSLFTSPGGDSNPTALFAEKTEVARRARNFGKALVRLKPVADAPGAYTTSIMFIRGRNSSGVLNPVPIGFVADPQDSSYTDWAFGRNDAYLNGWAVTNKGTVNAGQRGDVIIAWFNPLDEGFDGPDTNQVYLMVVNGLVDPAGTASCLQEIRLNFQFPAGLSNIVMLNPVTGQLETNTVPIVGGPRQPLLNLNGGDAALFKFATGAPFVGWGPAVALTTPVNGAVLAGPRHLELAATGADQSRPLTKVDFFVGDTKVGQDTSPPFSFTWSNAVEGIYTLTAVGTDNAGRAATSAPVTVTLHTGLVRAGSIWKYLDNGSNQGTAWRNTNFNDSAWASGPAQLGYGDADEATVVGYGPDINKKYITTYFRHSFGVPPLGGLDPPVAGLFLRVLRDDGAVVYLNGVEVFRSNMPGGTIGHTTLALGSVPPADETTMFHTANVVVNRLVAGPNVLAVEVHQASTNSSDLSFDLELLALRSFRPPALSITRRAFGIELKWSAFTYNYRPESSPTLAPGANWSFIPNPILTSNNQHIVRLTPTATTFFRLRQP